MAPNVGVDANRTLFHVSDWSPVQREHLQFFDRALTKIQALPGVQSAAGTFRVPMVGFATVTFSVQGKPVPVGQAPSADYRAISFDYFRAMGIRLLKGREFNERDNAEAFDAVIVNDEFAGRYWPGEDPIGKRLQVGTDLRVGAKSSEWSATPGLPDWKRR